MGGCMSVCEKLFPGKKNKSSRQQKQESTYLDASFQRIKKPLLDNQFTEEEVKRNKKGQNRKSDEENNGKKQKKESISIEMQERRIMAEKQKELEEIEKEENEQIQKKINSNLQHSNVPLNKDKKDSLVNKQQQIQVNGQEQSQLQQVDSNSILKPKQQKQDLQKLHKSQHDKQYSQQSSLDKNSQTQSSYEHGNTKEENNIINQKNKKDQNFEAEGKNILISQKNDFNQVDDKHIGSNNIKNDKHSTFYKYKQSEELVIDKLSKLDDKYINKDQDEVDEFKNEKWKHIDQNKQIHLVSNKDYDNLRTNHQSNENEEISNIEKEMSLKEDDEEYQRQKEEKLKEVRKSIQKMNSNKNSMFHHQGNIYNQQIHHNQHSHQGQPHSVTSLHQEGQPKISNVHFPQVHSVGQNLNQYYCDDIDLSLLLQDSQKNSIFNGNFPYVVKDSKFFLDESIIHPIKPNSNGGVNYNGEGVDSDTSFRREDEWEMKKLQSTHDLVNILQACQQHHQLNQQSNQQMHSSHSSENLAKRVSIQLESKDGKVQKQKDDQIEYEKDKQNTGSSENIKNTLNNQINIQQQSQNSQNAQGGQLKKDNNQQQLSNDELVSSRRSSANSIKKTGNNKISHYDKNKSPQNSENPKLVPIKEEEMKFMGENSMLQLPSFKEGQDDFSFGFEQIDQLKQEEQNQNNNIPTAVMIQNNENSQQIIRDEQRLQQSDDKKQKFEDNQIDGIQQQINEQQQTLSNKQEFIIDKQLALQNNSQDESLKKQFSIDNKQEYSPNKSDKIQPRKRHSQSQLNLQEGIEQLQDQSNSFSNRYSLRQPLQKPIYNRSDSGNISIVVQDPKNIMTEQLIFSICPVNSKIQLNQNSSSQRESVKSINGGQIKEKKDSVLNRNPPHRSLLENTNRVIMQKRTSKKLVNPQPFQQQNSIFPQEQDLDIPNRKGTLDGYKEDQQYEKTIQDQNNNIDSEDFVYSGHQNNINRNIQELNAHNKISELPSCDEEQTEEEKSILQDDNNKQFNKNKNNSMKQMPLNQSQTYSTLEQNVRQFEEEIKKMKQEQINENEIIEQEIINNQQQNTEIDKNQYIEVWNQKKYSESYNVLPNNEDGQSSSISSPNIKPSSQGNSQRTSYRFYSSQNFTLNQQNSQKYQGNETPFQSCFNTPLTSKRGSQNVEQKVFSQSELLQRKSISGHKRVSYYKEANTANQYYDCDSYQVQIINSDQLQNKDLLEQPELYMQWIETLSKVPPEIFSSEAIYQFEIIKQETYQDFLYKFEQEYHYNLELFDPIYKENNQNIYFRSELGLDQERLFVITGEYYVNTSSYAAFYNFKNSFNIQQALNNFDYIFSVNDDLQNTVIYANCSAKQLQKPCEFVFLKHFSFLQQNVEMYNSNQDELIQPIEQICEIDISLNSEEIEQYIKKNKKLSNRGEIFSGNIATFIPELNQIKVEIMIEHNFHNLLTSSQAKNMYTEMFKNYFKKLNSAFN